MMTYRLPGKVDSVNAPEVTEAMLALAEKGETVCVDAEDAEYLSSAGLRALLKLMKKQGSLRILHVKDEVWNILEMTGFTELMQVERAFRRVSIEGCPIIGMGAKGTVYRLNQDTVIKVFEENSDLEAIRHEREMARRALIMGLPTAISFDIVQVGEQYASMYELLDCSSMSAVIAADVSALDGCAAKFAELLRQVHSVHVRPGEMPRSSDVLRDWRMAADPFLSGYIREKVKKLLKTLPETGTLVHGDYHTNNVMMQDGEPVLIDMDTLSTGHPLFDLANIWIAYVGFTRVRPDMVQGFLGIDPQVAERFWQTFLPLYLQTEKPSEAAEIEEQATLLGLLRVVSHLTKRNLDKDPEYRVVLEKTLQGIEKLAGRLDRLGF